MSHDFGDKLAYCRAKVLNLKQITLPPHVKESLAELDHYLENLLKEYHFTKGRLK